MLTVTACLGQNIARLEMLHGIFQFMKECGRTAQLAPSTTEKSMDYLDYFSVKPKSGKCEIMIPSKMKA